jgi:hypothetical protein
VELLLLEREVWRGAEEEAHGNECDETCASLVGEKPPPLLRPVC